MAHKCILAARSPVFKAMFSHKELFKEAAVDHAEVTITDVEPDIFDHLINYIYINKIPPLDKEADELLAAADKVR